MSTPSTTKFTAVIVGPPWPHSGTARVIQNQVEFYRERGYSTIFICVPIHCSYTETYPEWVEIESGLREIGADRTFFARINSRRFVRGKYSTWIRRGLRSTALEWIVFTGGSADLNDNEMREIRDSNVALMQVNHVFTLGFAQRLLRQVISSDHRIPVILETHDVQSHLLAERGDLNPWTHRLDKESRLLQAEVSLLKKADVLVHCSVDDFEFFKSRVRHNKHVLALPTIDEAFVSTVDSRAPGDGPIDLLFVGQSTGPNLAAMKWFFDKVWPLIADRGYCLLVVGKVEMLVRKELPEIFRRYKEHFVGPVLDLAPYYSRARCVFAPMVSGTGISIKTIEALALGKPFVGTSKAYRGMPLTQLAKCGLRPLDTPQAFADGITSALADQRATAQSSCCAYEKLFSKRAAFSSRDEALRMATAN